MMITKLKLREIIRELIREFIKEDKGPCWDGYKQVGMKDKGGKQVPNCVPISEILKLKEGDTEYQLYFRKELEKTGKSSPAEMSDAEKREFFNKIDSGWKGKTEGNAFGAAVVKAKKAGKDEFSVDGKKFSVKEEKSKYKKQNPNQKYAPNESVNKNPKLKDMMADLFYESVTEGRKSKDGWGVRLVIAIDNNVQAIVELVMDDKKDPKEVISAFANPLLNSVKGVSNHNYKPNAKPVYTLKRDLQRYGDLTNQQRLDIFKSEIKKFKKIVEALIKKPTKIGVKQLDDAWRTIWNHKYGATIGLNGEEPYDNTIIEISSHTTKKSVKEEKSKYYVEIDTPREVDSNRVKGEIKSFMKRGAKAVDIGLRMNFLTTNPKDMMNKFQKVKNHVYFANDPRRFESVKRVNEGNAFGMAVTKAKEEGKDEFEFNGKTYRVKNSKNESKLGGWGTEVESGQRITQEGGWGTEIKTENKK